MKPAIYCFLILISSLTSYGQNVQVELYSALTFCSVNEKVEEDYYNANSFSSLVRFPTIGVICDFQMGKTTLLETGLVYAPRGSKIFDSKLYLDYVDIPVNLVLQPKLFRFFIGPQISILTSARIDDIDSEVAFEKSDWGLRYGLGSEFKRLSFKLVFQNGLTDVFKDERYRWRANSTSINISYLIKKMNRLKNLPNDPLKEFRENGF